MRVKFLSVLALTLLLAVAIPADDGMWMPHQMKDLNLQSEGLQMDPSTLFRPDGTGLMSAVVHLGGGTGEFVSADGLILTNHHVAFGAIQRASDPEHDYIENGFVSGDRAREIPAQGYIADVLLSYEDVTPRVQAALTDGMTPLQRFEAIDRVSKEIVAEAEKSGPDIRCELADMYSGNRYYLFRFKRLRDIRLVYAPPRDLGNYGGDIDNWMWPRHTCDFSFLRAYVSPDNVGVPYSADNVPYHPKSILKISLDGVHEGDFTFVMGYPGRTYRNYTLPEVRYEMERMNRMVDVFKDIIAFYDAAGRDDKAVEIKYAGKVKGLNNALKNYEGKLEGMRKVNLLERKAARQKEFETWARTRSGDAARYLDALASMDAFMTRYAAFQQRSNQLGALTSRYTGAAMLGQAYLIARTVAERQKPDMERESRFQERNLPYIRQQIKLAERGYDFATDRAYFLHQLTRMSTEPADRIPAAVREQVAGKSAAELQDYVASLYDATVLKDPQRRLALLDKTPAELAALKDPLLDLATRLAAETRALEDEEKTMAQQHEDLKKVVLAGKLEQADGRLAPDANGTIRFTCGTVKGYQPRDAVVYRPITTLTGMLEKETGTYPFHVPDKIKTLEKEKDFGRYADPDLGDIPTCFLNTTNVTGGNSGSPTLNAKGEQVGIIFDMTYESVIGDYLIIPALQRTISVDLRYVLFVVDKFSGAKSLMKELGF